jgi:phosphate-selective porin
MNRAFGLLIIAAAVSSASNALAQPTPEPTSPSERDAPAPAKDAPAEPPAPAPWPADTTPAAPRPAVLPDADSASPPGPAPSPLSEEPRPLAGFHHGLFFLRDKDDNFQLFLQARSQIDAYSYFGPGVADTTLKPTLFLRRIRPELTGTVLGRWSFMIAGDFGATAIDNPDGRSSETVAAAPGTAPSATTAKYAAAQTTRFQAAPTDVFINYREDPLFNVMVGQMDAPFTLENRTSDKYLPFAERSLAVRAVGVPTNKEIGAMFWGETDDHFLYYSVGPYMGDGQNKPNVDSRLDLFGRAFVHPLAAVDSVKKDDPLKNLQVGASVHYGSRDKRWVDYDYPSMTTQAAFTFWKPTYAGSNGTTHIIPSGDQVAVAGELRLPIGQFDLTSEVVYIDNNTREALEGYQSTNTERFGDLRGISYYAQLGYWIGKRDLSGLPGYENLSKLDWSKSDAHAPEQALQLLAKWEQVSLSYDSASRAGVADAKNIDGDIKVNAFSLGANYWATKHMRLSLNYVTDYFPSSAAGKEQTSANRAVAPGNTLPLGAEHGAREGAHNLNEIIARFAIAL